MCAALHAAASARLRGAAVQAALRAGTFLGGFPQARERVVALSPQKVHRPSGHASATAAGLFPSSDTCRSGPKATG